MNGKKLTERVLETIKKRGIKPRPRWEFLLRDYSLWVITILTIVIGGLAFSVVLYMFKNNDWDIYKYMNHSLFGFILTTLPYFWLWLLIIFILAARYNIKHTKKGYKYRLPLVVAGIIIFNVFLGMLSHNIGVGQAIDGVLSERMPWYEKVMNLRRGRWLEIDEGMVAGLIVEIADSEHFKLKDFRGRDWDVDATEARMIGGFEVRVGGLVRIIGEKVDEGSFKARVVAGGRAPGRHPLMPGGLPFPQPPFERNFLGPRIKE